MDMTKAKSRRSRRASPVRNGEAKVAKLKLDSIRLDAGTQTRAHIDDGTVTEYAEAMIRGDRFPPVVLFQRNGDLILGDGFHRVRAARKAKFKHIFAEIRQGTRRDAIRFALGANHKHGLRRTNADKRHGVEIALAEFASLSDGLLAEMCGVSQPLVTNIRHQLITVMSSQPRLGKDGKLRALPVRGINGSARPEVVGDNAAFMEVAEALASLESLVERVVQEHPDSRAAVQAAIGKVRTDLLNLDKRIAATA